MKRRKFNPIQLILLSIIAIALSSCVPVAIEIPRPTEVPFTYRYKEPINSRVVSKTAEFTAIYKMNGEKVESYQLKKDPGTLEWLTYSFEGVSSLMLDQRKSDGTTNWNYKYGRQIPRNEANSDNPTLYYIITYEQAVDIYSEPTTPALYNKLCAEYWNEPIKDGELSRAWKLAKYQNNVSTYDDDMIKFSAFDNKVSFKPGEIRTTGLSEIVDATKNEVFGSFSISKELLPKIAYTTLDLLQYIFPQEMEAQYAKISYNNGKKDYEIKIYYIDKFEGKDLIYIHSSDGVNNFQFIEPVTDDEYTNYQK